MKKWYLGIIAGIAVAVILGLSGMLIYKFYITPKFLQPIVEEISDYLQDSDVLDSLYDEAVNLHDDGVIDDETYANFVRMYNDYYRDDVEYAKKILEEKDNEKNLDSENLSSSVSARYASNKVGAEIIREKDGSGGKADVRYSDERTSDRIQSEDIITAEKVLEQSETEETETPTTVASVYEKLKSKMTASEFSTFTKIMSKLNLNTLKTYASDKEGLKQYLHSRLSDEEYSNAVQLGYKYVYLFLDKDNK